MKARVKATGEVVEVEDCGSIFRCGILFHGYKDTNGIQYLRNEIDFDFCKARQDETPYSPDYWTRLEHQYAGMAMQGLLSNPNITERVLTTRKGIVEDAERLAHALVKKVRYEENPKELEGLKKELEALKIEKTILENKIKLLKEERK